MCNKERHATGKLFMCAHYFIARLLPLRTLTMCFWLEMKNRHAQPSFVVLTHYTGRDKAVQISRDFVFGVFCILWGNGSFWVLLNRTFFVNCERTWVVQPEAHRIMELELLCGEPRSDIITWCHTIAWCHCPRCWDTVLCLWVQLHVLHAEIQGSILVSSKLLSKDFTF